MGQKRRVVSQATRKSFLSFAAYVMVRHHREVALCRTCRKNAMRSERRSFDDPPEPTVGSTAKPPACPSKSGETPFGRHSACLGIAVTAWDDLGSQVVPVFVYWFEMVTLLPSSLVKVTENFSL